MDNVLMMMMALSVPVASLVELLKQGLLKRLQERYQWSAQTYAGVVTLVSIVVSEAILGGIMLSGATFPLLPAIGLNADLPVWSWLLGGFAIAFANHLPHEGLDFGKSLVTLLRNYADLLDAKVVAAKATLS